MLGAAHKSRRRIGIGNDRRSVAALEFALLAPVIIALFFGVYDISDAMISYEEVFNAARTIAASTSNISVQGANSSTQLYYAQTQLEASAILAQMPSVRSGLHHGIQSITISSVNFEVIPTTPACTPGVNCNYNAYVVWSTAYTGPPGGAVILSPALRGCATESLVNGVETVNTNSALTQVAPNGGGSGNLNDIATLNVTTPDPGPAAPDPIIVVDVHYQFTPLFNIFVKNPIDYWANGFWPLRSVQAAILNGNGTFTKLAADQQYTGLVSTPAQTSPVTPPYTIKNANVNPPTGPVGVAPAQTNYCISSYYSEPQT